MKKLAAKSFAIFAKLFRKIENVREYS